MTRTLTALTVLTFFVAAQPAGAQTYPRPSVADVSPKSVTPATGSFTLTVRGTGMIDGVSQIYWNGAALAGTTCTAASSPNMASCSATVPAAGVVVGTAAITVANPGAGADILASNAKSLAVTTAIDPVFCDPSGVFRDTPLPISCPYWFTTTASHPYAAVVADFNGDGSPDTAVRGVESITVQLGTANGRYATTTSFPVAEPPGLLVAADVNEDGWMDLVVVSDGDGISVFLGNGDGTFTTGPVTSRNFTPLGRLAAVDMNGDGHVDLVFERFEIPSFLVQTFLGDGQGHFAPAPAPFVTGFSSIVITHGLVVGDFDGDGSLDVVFTVLPGQIWMLRGDGLGGFASPSTFTYDSGPSSSFNSLAAGDFNHDGVLDLAVSNRERVAVLLGDGAGTFTPSPSSPLASPTSAIQKVELADLDGDGNLDVAILGCSVSSCNRLVLSKGDGQGGFSAPLAIFQNPNATDFALVDLNDDGRLDYMYLESFDLFGDYISRLTAVQQFATGSVSPTFWSFGEQTYLTSSTKAFTVSASGSAPLFFSSIAVDSDVNYHVTGGTCSLAAPLAPGTSCTVDVTFTPAVAGFPTAILTVADSGRASGDSHDVQLAGADMPAATLTYGSPYFGGQLIGSDNVLPVTLKSTGKGPILLSVDAYNGTFDKGSCPASPGVVLPGESCDFYLHWVPQTRGASFAQFYVYNRTSGIQPQSFGSIFPGGIGYSGAYSLSAASLTFPAQGVNTTSAARSVTVTNTATSPLSIYSIGIYAWPVADFAVANTSTCGSTVAPSATCRVDVTFTPTTNGDRFASLTFDTSALTSPGADVSGTGVANPVPFVSAPLVPSAIAPGGGSDVPLIVRGAGFVDGAVVRFNGSPLATSFVNVDQLTATIPVALVAAARTAQVTVFNPAPGGGESNIANLPIATAVASVSLSRNDVTAGAAPEAMAAGDFNGDGIPDLAAALCSSDRGTVTPCDAGKVAILIGTGGGNFAAPSILTLSGSTADGIVAGDFDKDGKLDLVVSHWFSQSITVLRGDGAGNFAVSPDSPINLNWYVSACSAAALAAGDFNGDGSLDLVVVDSNPDCGGQAFVFPGAAGTISPLAIGQASVGLTQSVAIGDFNGDGNLDIAGADAANGFLGLTTWNAAGGYLDWVDPIGGLSAPDALVVADFNGDGKADIAVTETGTASVTVFLGDGAAAFSRLQSYATGNGPRAVSAADLNGDGALDLVVANSDDDSVTILHGNGTGAFAAAGSAQSVGGRPRALVTSDVDGDGRLDVVTVNRDDNTVTVLRQNAPVTTPTATTIGAPAVTYGANGVVTVSVSAAGGTVNGTVSLSVDSGAPQSMALTNGQAVFTLPTPAGGSHSLSASFATQNGFLESSKTGTLQVNRATTATRIVSTASNPAAPGQAVVVAFAVTANPTATGSVTVTASTGQTCDGNLSGGSGSCSMTFATTGARTLTASYGGNGNFVNSTSAAVTQNVNGPVGSLTPASYNFGTVYLEDKPSATFTLTNTGNAPLKVTDIAIVAPGSALPDFTQKGKCPPSIAPGANCVITVALEPRAVGVRTATLRVTSNGAGSAQTTSLSATVINPKATLGPPKVDFPKQKVGTVSAAKTVTLTNSGTTPLLVGTIAVTGDFALAATTTCVAATSLAPGASCRLDVTFKPTAKGKRNGSLAVTDNAKNSPQTVTFSGEGN